MKFSLPWFKSKRSRAGAPQTKAAAETMAAMPPKEETIMSAKVEPIVSPKEETIMYAKATSTTPQKECPELPLVPAKMGNEIMLCALG
jgi:hypothetical protein